MRNISKHRVVMIVAAALALLIFAFIAWRLGWFGVSPAKPETESLSKAPSFAQPKVSDAVANLTPPSARDGNGAANREPPPPGERGDKETEITQTELPESQPQEVCGLTTAEASAFFASHGTVNMPDVKPVLAEVVSRLIESDDLREKTLGLYIVARQAGMAAMEAERLNYPGCKSSEACSAKPYEAMQQALPTNAAALVNLALTTGDLDVYSAALSACSGAATGACSDVSAARWAEMEPDNAVAWLMAASEADARKDIAARDAALRRAVTAKVYNTRLPSMAPIITSDSVRSLPPLVQASMENAAFGDLMMRPKQVTDGLMRYCVQSKQMVGNRPETCDALATTLLEKDETLSAAMTAAAIGKRVGWSKERLQAVDDEISVAVGYSLSLAASPTGLSCDSLTKLNEFSQKMVLIGERAAVRELVNSSGKTLAELAAYYRKKGG